MHQKDMQGKQFNFTAIYYSGRFDKFNITEQVVYLDGTIYKFSSFLTCLDICFKIFQCLNLIYPDSCYSVWLFVQKYFYGIKTHFDKNIPSVIGLISTLNS